MSVASNSRGIVARGPARPDTLRALGASTCRRAALKVTLLLTTVWLGSTEARAADPADLAPGQLAALAILSQDVCAAAADQLPATTSVLTLVGGQVVHDAGLLEPR